MNKHSFTYDLMKILL